ncbi:jg5257 [Pararge aegeria aegeria]|uniref:Jg5257 protein n=1 Tax=Pararge aegeria aegeria TaxID=348720 RepID=A0A8S4QUS4_9NEOP|nr:jg5257 [Pararge aegeria aegeria]
MERAMLGVSLRDRVTEIAQRVAKLAGGRWLSKVLEWRPRTGKRSVGRPPNEVDRRHQASRWEPLETSGPGPWILELSTKDLCPAVDFNRLKIKKESANPVLLHIVKVYANINIQ